MMNKHVWQREEWKERTVTYFFSQDLLPEDDNMEPLNDKNQSNSPNMTLTQPTPNTVSLDTPEMPIPVARII